MKKNIGNLGIFFLISSLIFSQTHAEMITGVHGGDYWRMAPARYETKDIQDPVGAKIENVYSREKTTAIITINSAILPISQFIRNIVQLKKDCKKSEYYREMPSMCDAYDDTTNTVMKKFIMDYTRSNTKTPTEFQLPLRVLIEGMHADIYKDGDWRSIFQHWQGTEFVSAYRVSDGSVMGVQKLYGGDYPSYFIFRLYITGTRILFQQSELVPSMVLYDGVSDKEFPTFMKTFDANLKGAIGNGFEFKNADFKKRFLYVSTYFKNQQRLLIAKKENKTLSKAYKIEGNTVKWRSTGAGDEQWLSTNIDPHTMKISENGNSGVDKYGPFVEGMRLLGGDSSFYTLSKESVHYWAKQGSDSVYTYSNNNDGMLSIIPLASVKTLQFRYILFSDPQSLCKPTDNSTYSYDAYDEKYCYGKAYNQGGVEVIGKRK